MTKNKMRQSLICVMVMLGLIISGMVSAGCIDSIPKNLVEKQPQAVPDPETGITAWIDAVNDRNYGAVYDLMPASKRTGITRVQYIQLNQENPSPFLTSELVVSGFFIMNKRVDGLNATITAGLQTNRNSSDNNESSGPQVFFTFEETFEENEWKVWTRK